MDDRTYAVRYYTKNGNTKRLAEAMAKELGVADCRSLIIESK